jgi:hypothetical protein
MGKKTRKFYAVKDDGKILYNTVATCKGQSRCFYFERYGVSVFKATRAKIVPIKIQEVEP